MKSLLTIFTLVFTMIFSVTSFGEWTKVLEDADGVIHYVDFERIRKIEGYVYFWALQDLPKPDQDGDLSYVTYYQSDCKLLRARVLTEHYFLEQMGDGSLHSTFTESDTESDKEWMYAPPDSAGDIILDKVCSR